MTERQKGRTTEKNENTKRQKGTFTINILHVASLWTIIPSRTIFLYKILQENLAAGTYIWSTLEEDCIYTSPVFGLLYYRELFVYTKVLRWILGSRDIWSTLLGRDIWSTLEEDCVYTSPVFGRHTLLDPRVAWFLWMKDGLKKSNLDLWTWQAHVTVWTDRRHFDGLVNARSLGTCSCSPSWGWRRRHSAAAASCSVESRSVGSSQ